MQPSPLALVTLLAVALALYAWGRWVCRRQRAPLYRLAARGILAGSVLALAGTAWALRELAKNPAGVSEAASEHAAAQLADRTAHAMAVAAWPVGIGNLVLLASVLVLLIGTFRAPDRAQPPRR